MCRGKAATINNYKNRFAIFDINCTLNSALCKLNISEGSERNSIGTNTYKKRDGKMIE